MKKLFLTVLTLFLTANFALCTTTSYDKYGTKTGSYKYSSNSTITKYDKYGSKVGSYSQTSSGYTSYDRYGSKTVIRINGWAESITSNKT